MENAKTIRAVDGVSTLVYGLRDAARRYDATECVVPSTSADPSVIDRQSMRERSGSSNLVPVDPHDIHSSELMDVLAMLYFVVEVFRNDDTFGDELSKF